MTGGEVRLTLHDGEDLTIPAGDVDRVYENLWRLAPKPGAVTLAGVLVAQSRARTGLRPSNLRSRRARSFAKPWAMPDA